MPQITDVDVLALVGVADTMKLESQVTSDAWDGSPFAWVRNERSSRRRGTLGERLIAGFLTARGFNVSRAPDSECDRLVNGKRAEIKFSTLWETGVYKFQQIRDQRYEFAICLGISPFYAHAWVLPKSVLRARVIGQMGQHGGAAGQDTAWLSVAPEAPYEWMRPFGGSLADAVAALGRLVPRS